MSFTPFTRPTEFAHQPNDEYERVGADADPRDMDDYAGGEREYECEGCVRSDKISSGT